jgi:hypothetical protein
MSKTKLFILISLCLVLFSGYVNAETKKVAGRSTTNVAGSWIVNGTPDPQSGIPQFVNFSTMTKDGSIINIDPLDGTGVGEWKKSGDHKYSVTFRGFTVIDGQSMHYRVRGEIQLGKGGNQFDGEFVTDIFDPDGNIVFSVPGTIHAERFKVEKF